MFERCTEALAHMRSALAILDKADAPPHVGQAHLDLAIVRLQEFIDAQPIGGPLGSERCGPPGQLDR